MLSSICSLPPKKQQLKSVITRSVATRDKVLLQELDHEQPKHPCLVHDNPEIVMTIQQDVHKPKKPCKSNSRSKNFNSKEGAASLVQNPALSVLPSGVQQATNTAPYPGQYQVPPANQFSLWWAWGPLPLPRTGTCGKKDHFISCSPDNQPVYMTLLLSSLAATLQQQCRDLNRAKQLHLLLCQHSNRLHQFCTQGARFI